MSRDLAGQIKKKEDEVAKLRTRERRTYDDYMQARTKLSTVKMENLQEKANAKLWNFWIKCGEDIWSLAVWALQLFFLMATLMKRQAELAKAERELADMREKRAELVVKDRLGYELELLR
ncbi:hypothetical protein E8E13_003341 [Curvularia kusanoi]|uniref:Uncharacterized protein n=1 Tax=Curvularia kusanoi TaxID=90978 RepID=A0A9P4T4N9_CURKU|nr:hypothetical protein E8E13_003341 [Curvularia kusanoi]